MPFSSAEISGLVGNQTAMFSNQHSYAQQLSGLYGAGPQQTPTAMQPMMPPPSYAAQPMPITGWGAHTGHMGSTVVGGMAQALPGMLGAASLAGGLMSGMPGLGGLGILDPFSMALKAGGMGFKAAGIGGGLMAGAAATLPYYAAYKGVEAVGQQMYTGAQNVSDVGRMAGMYMGPQFGEAGARAGGAMGRQNIKGIVSVLEDIASQDVMVTVESAKRLMDKFGQMGLLQGIGDAQTFRNKFGGLVKQANEVAKILGTSLEEAAPLMGQFRSMGLWSARDVMGAAGAMRQVGAAAAPYMMGAMGAGAQMAHQMGGALGAGARIGQQAFMGVGTALRTGTLREEQIMEMTGGVGGLQGQQMVAQQMSGVMSQFSESAMGRLMMAGMGKFEGGRFTGGVDEKTLARFQRGEISVAELQRIGQQRTRGSREAAVSWEVNRGRIGQEMMAQGGMEGMAQAVTQVMEKAGYGDAGEDIKNMFIQKMTGVDARTADMIRRMGDDMPRIMAEKRRRAEAELTDRFRQVDERMNHSFQGLKDALGQASENFWRPVREFGANMATEMSSQMDRANDVLMGRTKGMQFGEEARRAILRSNLGMATGADVTAATTRTMGTTSLAEQIRMGGFSGLGAAMTGGGAGTRADMLRQLGAQTVSLGAGGGNIEGFAEAGSTRQRDLMLTAGAAVFGPLGVGAGALGMIPGQGEARTMVNTRNAQALVNAAMLRATTGSAAELGITSESDTRLMGSLSNKLRAMGGTMGTADKFRKIRELTGPGEAGHARAVFQLLESDEGTKKQIDAYLERRGLRRGTDEGNIAAMNLLRASAEGAGQDNPLRFDYERMANEYSGISAALKSGSPEQANAMANTILSGVEKSTRGGIGWKGWVAAVGAAPVTGGLSLLGAATEAISGLFGGPTPGSALIGGAAGREDVLRKAIQSGGIGFLEYLKTGESAWSRSDAGMAIIKELKNAGYTEEELRGQADKIESATGLFAKGMRTESLARGKEIGAAGLAGIEQAGLRGPTQEKVRAYLKALAAGQDPAEIERTAGEAAAVLTGKEDLSALGAAGGFLQTGSNIERWGRGRGTQQFKDISAVERSLRMEIPKEMRESVQKMLKDGLDAGERDIIRQKMAEAWRKEVPAAAAGGGDPGKMTDVTAKYIQVATDAINKLKEKTD